ncbi:uncharacterized protein UV8b_07011 [Ustilaginoidea virens]|uniref:Peptidase S26 domain-containing protein n=1 Tax=Ustilaginoidea virens TaxID=1159556 RepID=A0A063CB42_USTVR|nr:uncharacterized protein UV8b_07011 [Ustilaginoidea virens]QUC22770.1 hypothetical protein UV8b_07011 [Ustilaginoidea virens]GAO15417.1 hypothetical protein UVI_02010770 [Ustilaginoidea virens]
MISHFLGHPVRLTVATLKFAFLSHLGLTHLFQVTPAQGASMLPTFMVDGDWIAADMRHRLGRGIAVGDVVLYKIPLFPDQNGVKRVLGMPGDYVSLGTPGETGEEQMIQVPEGHCWIVGDNLSCSRDSRLFGPLPLALVQGKVVAKILPWRERKWIASGVRQVAVDNPS